MPKAITIQIIPKSPAPLRAKISDPNSGARVKQENLEWIRYQVWTSDMKTKIKATTTVDIATTIFDSLQLDGSWTRDAEGYNFAFSAPASCFPSNATYLIVFRFQPTVGDHFHVVFRASSIPNPYDG